MPDATKDTSRRVLLGRIAGAHGIRGAVLIKTFTAEPEGIADYGALEDSSGRRSFEIEIERVTPKGVIGRVNGVSDRTQAEALKGIDLYVPRERMPAPAEGEFYFEDLKGLEAVAADGKTIGKVTAVVNYGAGDILEIRVSDGGHTALVPFMEAYIGAVDLAAGRITVTLPGEIDAGDAQGGPESDHEPS
jgi:16S rRNA processing protein RimM